MSIRDYDKARVQRLGLAFYATMLKECTDQDGVCFVPVVEILDAMAMLGGVLLTTGPAARSNTKLREITTDFGKSVAAQARLMKDAGADKMFDFVLGEEVTH